MKQDMLVPLIIYEIESDSGNLTSLHLHMGYSSTPLNIPPDISRTLGTRYRITIEALDVTDRLEKDS